MEIYRGGIPWHAHGANFVRHFEESFTIRSMDGVTRNLFQREDHWKGKELARISLRASERLLENNDSNVVTRSLPALRIQLDEILSMHRISEVVLRSFLSP